MKTTTEFQDLSITIEQLVQAHLLSVRAQVEEAISRAFGAAIADKPQITKHSPKLRCKQGKHRTPDEIVILAEKFLKRVSDKPGDTMTIIAAEMGIPTKELHQPMSKLKAAGKIRSTGERHLTRYFPSVPDTKASD